MNRFIEAIETKLLERVPSQRFPRLSVQVTKEEAVDFAVLGAYRLTIRWSRVITCDEKHYDLARKKFTDELKEFIFGEIRDNLRELEVAIIEQRDEDALHIAHGIQTQMFG